jgi:hypothetical protein
LNQVQNTNQSNELANQKRKKHRTRHRKAKNQRALETDTEYPPKPSQMKNKNSLQPFQKKKTTLQSPQKKNTNQQPPQKKKISPQSPQKNTNITESHQLKAEKTAIASQTSKSKAPVSIKTATELDFVSTIPNNTLNIEDSSDEESFHTCSSNPQSLQSESILHTPAFPFHQPSSESKSDSSAIEAFSPQSTNPEQLVPRSPSLLSPESWQRTPPAFSPLTPSLKRDQLSISQTLPKLSSSQIMQSSLVKKLDSIVLISSSDEEDDEDVILISDSDAEEVVTSSYTTDPARP